MFEGGWLGKNLAIELALSLALGLQSCLRSSRCRMAPLTSPNRTLDPFHSHRRGLGSQMRMTCHPASLTLASVSLSLATLPASFSDHHFWFAVGIVPCWGQQCQKHPSTKTATRGPRNTRSARRLDPASGASSTRYRSPRRCNSLRPPSSLGVSRSARPLMRFDTAGVEAGGTGTYSKISGSG